MNHQHASPNMSSAEQPQADREGEDRTVKGESGRRKARLSVAGRALDDGSWELEVVLWPEHFSAWL